MTVYAQPNYGANQQFPWQTGAMPSYMTANSTYDSGMGAYNQPAQGYGNNIGDLLKYAAGAKYNFEGQNIKQQQGIAGDIGNLANASYDVNSPLYKQIYGDELQSNQQNLAASINEAMAQNRKAAALGRVPLFNPERQGEVAFRTMAGGYAANQDAARARARQIIGAGQNAKQNAYDAAAASSAAQQQNKKSKLLGMGNIADALPLLLKFL